MAERKPFLLRLPPELLEQLRRWAGDEMRSLNGQIEFVLRQALKAHGRVVDSEDRATDAGDRDSSPPTPK